MGKEEVGRENMAMERHCWKEAQPEARDSSAPYLHPISQAAGLLSPILLLPASLAPHSSRVTLPAKWPWLWNLAGQAGQCLEDMSLAKLHFTQTPSARSHRSRVWSETRVCTK